MEVKLELGNCFFYTTWGKASLLFSLYWSIAHSFHHSCDFSIRGFIFRRQFVVPDSDLWLLLGDSGASSPGCVTYRGSFQCPISSLAYRCFAERLHRRHVSSVAFQVFNSSVRVRRFPILSFQLWMVPTERSAFKASCWLFSSSGCNCVSELNVLCSSCVTVVSGLNSFFSSAGSCNVAMSSSPSLHHHRDDAFGSQWQKIRT